MWRLFTACVCQSAGDRQRTGTRSEKRNFRAPCRHPSSGRANRTRPFRSGRRTWRRRWSSPHARAERPPSPPPMLKGSRAGSRLGGAAYIPLPRLRSGLSFCADPLFATWHGRQTSGVTRFVLVALGLIGGLASARPRSPALFSRGGAFFMYTPHSRFAKAASK
jgi:hypothetical protein